MLPGCFSVIWKLAGSKSEKYVLNSYGMAHSDQIREFRLTDHGNGLFDVCVGLEGVLTGSAQLAQETKDGAEK